MDNILSLEQAAMAEVAAKAAADSAVAVPAV